MLKRLLISIVLFLYVTGCSQPTEDNVEVIQKDEEIYYLKQLIQEKDKEIKMLKEELQQLYESTSANKLAESKEYENFDPKQVKVGDKVSGLIISENELNWDGTENSYITKFFGDVEVSGTIITASGNDQFKGLTITLDDESKKKIPTTSEGGPVVFEISNSEFVEDLLPFENKKAVNATIVISNLVLGYSKDKPWSNKANIVSITSIHGKANGKIPLHFKPVGKETLPIIHQRIISSNSRTLNYRGINGLGTVGVTLLKGEEHIRAYLEHNGKLYDVGSVALENQLEDVSVALTDVTGDGVKELLIQGIKGTTYIELNIVGFNEKSKQWERLLQTGSPAGITDVDRDGILEIFATSRGSNPAYVWIYRWHQNQFYKIDVAATVPGTYASLTSEQNVIEVGIKDAESEKVEKALYKYKEGSLIKLNE